MGQQKRFFAPFGGVAIRVMAAVTQGSREAVGRILDTTLENLRAFLRGQPQYLIAPAH